MNLTPMDAPVSKTLRKIDLGFQVEKCLPDMLWEQVLLRPEKTAVVCEEERLSYQELAESSLSLAATLQNLGAVADECVGIFVEPSLDLIVGAWGILFSGAAYLPLSPEYPEERLRYMIEDARLKIVVCQKKLRSRLMELAPPEIRIVTIDDGMEFLAIQDITEKPRLVGQVNQNNLAYVVYTSGSTGKPKGVMIEHRSIVSQMNWLQRAYKLNHKNVVLQKTPMSFDAAQWEILAPSCGSVIVVGNPGVYRDPERLVSTIIRHQITTLQCVPTLLQALVDADGFRDCTSLTQIFCGGEILSKHLAQQCLETLPNCDLINLYGPTECTINASAHKVDSHALVDGPNAISIGIPVDNTQYYVLDSLQLPVVPGEIGELYIGGVQLARGYLHRPELTADRFIDNPFANGEKLYRTGDLVLENADGTFQFVGRKDNQVKLRGFRVELDEIRLAIEAHDWVKHAAVLIKNDIRTGFQNLIACVELNPREATLMDQGNHASHHQSKESRVQIRAQLANVGCRESHELLGKKIIELPGKTPSNEQRRRVFARKTYRFFNGGNVNRADILQLLGKRQVSGGSRSLGSLSLEEFGKLLRYFGQYISSERLLPKYGYASPGALYATQLYFELHHICGQQSGYYYYHPLRHELILINEITEANASLIKIHFIGKKRAIEPIYKNNILEVLEIEAGHILGLFDEVLPEYQLSIGSGEFIPTVKASLECADEDYYLGSFELIPRGEVQSEDEIDIYVQAHSNMIADLPAGLYRFTNERFEKISDEIIQKRHVIAINQQVYERSSFGISLVSRAAKGWLRYIALGRRLQRLQTNNLNLGLMSSGYSSKTGNDLLSAKRMASILAACGVEFGSFYFFIGGRVSEEQIRSEGMDEDVIHMKGPAELIREDLSNRLPSYMVPNKVIIMDKLPLTANGKIDHKALAMSEQVKLGSCDQAFVAPRTQTEKRIEKIWRLAMKWDAVSVKDDFFQSGGNSLMAVMIINKINKEFTCSLPLQILFDAPTIEKLASKIDDAVDVVTSRLVRLTAVNDKQPIYCWPGLGGYPMNLKLLASKASPDRTFYGVQACGINQGETPFSSIKEMAMTDLDEIRRVQPFGPYTLWGYSFGARVAFEVAYRLEQAGECVDSLFLIAPGSPKMGVEDRKHSNEPTYDNTAFVAILFSVFAHSITSPALDECLKVVRDEASFIAFICARYKHLDPELVGRIIKVVCQTYEFKYTFNELVERQISAPITIFKAKGDDYSFIENHHGYSKNPPTVFDLESDHYSVLKDQGIDELVKQMPGVASRTTIYKTS